MVATGKSVAIRAVSLEGVEMSATQVRKDALTSLVRGDGSFHKKYSGYYGPHTENVFGEIGQIASTMSQAQVVEYIATGELPKKSKTKSKKKKENKGENE
jgi:hypothetical protein